METIKSSFHFSVLKYVLRSVLFAFPVAGLVGTAVAFFLWLLNAAIHFRFTNAWLLFLLPLAGVLIHFIYKLYGKSSEKGNNLIIDEIHAPGQGVPIQMAPLILSTTIITHLFGGSAGREGTAVQIGGSIAGWVSKMLKLSQKDRRFLLLAGVAAGFGAVFGTPLTGAIFALEVISLGRIKYDALIPCLVASLVADQTVKIWGIQHTAYHIVPFITDNQAYLRFDYLLMLKVIVASLAFGLSSYVFIKLAHAIKAIMNQKITPDWLIPIIGGALIIFLTFINGKADYLSLGVDAQYPGAITIQSAFQHGGADTWSWLWKTLYTSITLGTGFKGGEVTPLFYIGATLGNTMAELMHAPVSLFAALGFIAVFAGATNTPIACTFMGIELFGGEYALYFACACFIAYYFSGSSGIYSSQRTSVPKIGNL